ncbi:MAG: hypothetical protein SFX73_19505 [Kofleriaceae bacterium]|nr:hypothetical protein [Kofleriaceae bacterium]
MRIRHGWLAAALALSVGAGACKKKEENKPAQPAAGSAATTPTPAEKPATGTPAPAPSAPAAGASDDLSLLPVDSEVVMGLNFSQLQKSVLWKKFVEPQLAKSDVQQKLGKFKDTCGFDPISAVTSLSVGVKGVGQDKPDGVFVIHGPEKGKVMACLDKVKAEAEKEGTAITVDSDVVTFKGKDGDQFAFTYVNDTTVVGVVGAEANPAGVKKAAAGGSALKTSPAFVEMYGKIKSQDSLWMLMNGNSKAFDQAAGLGFRPKAVFGSVNVTDGLSVDMNVRLESPEKATQFAGMMKQQAGQLAPMVDKLDINSDAADVKVAVAMSSQKLDALITQFGGLLGR